MEAGSGAGPHPASDGHCEGSPAPPPGPSLSPPRARPCSLLRSALRQALAPLPAPPAPGAAPLPSPLPLRSRSARGSSRRGRSPGTRGPVARRHRPLRRGGGGVAGRPPRGSQPGDPARGAAGPGGSERYTANRQSTTTNSRYRGVINKSQVKPGGPGPSDTPTRCHRRGAGGFKAPLPALPEKESNKSLKVKSLPAAAPQLPAMPSPPAAAALGMN